jgi:Dyp-type peroxidase family
MGDSAKNASRPGRAGAGANALAAAAAPADGARGGGGGEGAAAAPDLRNKQPIDPADPAHAAWLGNLQGNILTGHGRDHTVHIFIRLPGDQAAARALVAELARHVTSASKQETERQQFKSFGIPGALFGNLLLSAHGYRRLGFSDEVLRGAFEEAANQPRPTASNFLDGMAKNAVSDLGDPPLAEWEPGFDKGDIDAMLLLADDDEDYLGRRAREVVDALDGRCGIARIERGKALRTDEGEGIEHFGYVDGRSQPLFLSTDFANLEGGAIGPGTTEAGGGKIDVWNPFEPLELVLLPDPLAERPDCLGSYFVFRKVEQNVRDFIIEEQRLADRLGLQGTARERAGAMVVGRFRDGTPIVLSQTDGFIPQKENNFRYDRGPGDKDALRCPFHGHIRKTNPRGDIVELGAPEEAERAHRIARRGITYGKRDRDPDAFQVLDDLPSKDVGLLFMCFQASIRNQFAFMQRGWANNQGFVRRSPQTGEPLTGIDPIIGQFDSEQEGGPKNARIDQTWKPRFGEAEPTVETFFGDFVKMRGGEFFFAPSIPFLRNLAAAT